MLLKNSPASVLKSPHLIEKFRATSPAIADRCIREHNFARHACIIMQSCCLGAAAESAKGCEVKPTGAASSHGPHQQEPEQMDEPR
jgi:hypothetical protein